MNTLNVLTKRGHSNVVNCVRLSHDGKTLFTSSWDHTARSWDVATGSLKQIFEGHTDKVWGLCVSHDGTTVFTSGSDNTARSWNAATGEAKLIFHGHTERSLCACVSQDGATLFSGSRDKTARSWDTATGKAKQIFKGHEMLVKDVSVSPDGKTLYTASQDQTARSWDTATGDNLLTFKHTAKVLGIWLSRDGTTLFTGLTNNTACSWDAATAEAKLTFTGHADIILSLCTSHDDKTLFTTSVDKTVRSWDAATGEAKGIFTGHTDAVAAVCCSRDGSIFTSSDDLTARQWYPLSGITGPTLSFRSFKLRELLTPVLSFVLLTLQLLSFSFGRHFQWSEEVRSLQVSLPLLQLDFTLDEASYASKLWFTAACMLLFVGLNCVDAHGSLVRLEQAKRKSKYLGQPADQWKDVWTLSWLLALGLKSVVWWVHYLGSTALFVPFVRAVAETIDCTAFPDGSWRWDLFPEVECFQGAHRARSIAGVVALMCYLPYALRLAVVQGDCTVLHKERNFFWRVRRQLCSSWKPRAVRVLEIGILKTNPENLVANTMASALSNLVMAAAAVLSGRQTKVLSVVFFALSLFLLLVSVRFPRYRDQPVLIVMFTMRLLVLFTSACCIWVAFLNDRSTSAPAITFWALFIPVVVMGIKLGRADHFRRRRGEKEE